MKFFVHSFILLLAVCAVGCADDKPARTYDISDVEQLLIDHPELAEPPPAEYRVKD
ncbi:hypothetical protein [Rhodopirellula sp. SWK7]|uniref:hypothetical protein n=1 Tax=Rhodopirellula sp. SWK7 TaxID=595460 RepID=UPI0002BF39DD|nr:hypothetical protein [Rhodopirellula sp. SWK7]EMI45539.1 secreted protein [Rhodopirellula sp. SWK7]